MLQSYQIRVTVYRKPGLAPLVFGLDSGKPIDLNTDLRQVTISRRINQAAAVSIVLPGKQSRGGQWWTELISTNDWVQIDATVSRNPKRLSHPWRTVFFGYIITPGRDAVYSNEVSEDTTLNASCQMYWLEKNLTNYWLGVPGTFGGATQASEQIRKLTENNSDGGLVLFTTTAKALETMFTRLIYSFFPMRRQMNGGTLRWFDTHGFRFESDAFSQGLNMDQFAPHATSWLQGIMDLVDIPSFYQMYSDILPRTRILTGKGIHEQPHASPLGYSSERVAKKDSGLIFTGDQVDSIIVRPLPFPEYHKDGKYDSQAWDNLPTFYDEENLGESELSLRKAADPIFTYYTTSSVVGTMAQASPVMSANAIAETIWDVAKYYDLCGYSPCATGTRRLPFTIPPSAKEKTITPTLAQSLTTMENYADFLGHLNESLFSYHQFNDKFESGTHVGMLRLDLELGGRFVFDNNRMLGFIDGYTLTLGNNTAITQINLTRVLPIEVYQTTLPVELGRKRGDESSAPYTQRSLTVEGGQTKFDNNKIEP